MFNPVKQLVSLVASPMRNPMVPLRTLAAPIKARAALFSLVRVFRLTAGSHPKYKELLGETDFTVQIRLRDRGFGRWFKFAGGDVLTGTELVDAPDVDMSFESPLDMADTLDPLRDRLEVVSSLKSLRAQAIGDERFVVQFVKILNGAMDSWAPYGTKMADGTMRYTNNTNGGPVFVYVKDGKIVRITPLELADDDPDPWTIEARGRKFTAPKKASISPFTACLKSTIYSKDRILYPMKRVDFDPDGERNPQNRGKSGYARISWPEAVDLVAGEILRVKKEHGPGAIMNGSGSHHLWGNLGYWLSARRRFFNILGTSYVDHNPDSWEGWYWGAMHHWGKSMRLGAPDQYSTVEDALRHCELMVFWSSDPETTSGVYGAQEGTIRRLWAKDLGVEFVHIDPFYNHTAAMLGGKWLAPKPGSEAALAHALAYVWIDEGLYDKNFVETKTTGFEEWRKYLLGEGDGTPKTPEWQEKETGIPAREARALARKWGRSRTYLGAGGIQGFGSACRSATGVEWARSMVYLMAMQGIGRPGVNMGNLQQGAPVDSRFFFPGYAEGGLSGDVFGTGLAVNMYQRMPQVLTINTVAQSVPRLYIPEAILNGEATGWTNDSSTIEGQFRPKPYPAPGYSKVKLYYKYGGSHFGTMVETNRYARMYKSPELEFVVNQSIWLEGEAKFADVILPACTNFERWDVGEFANCGGYIGFAHGQVNNRIITMQHKCIEPLGESKSDFEIFAMIAEKLNLGAYFSESSSELDWCRRLFEATDMPRFMSWRKFLKKGYFAVPPPKEEQRDPVSWRWYYEGRKNDLPENDPLPSDESGGFKTGLQTQSGKIEFVSSSLSRYDKDDPERPPMSRYQPSWEGPSSELYQKYPLQLISPHNRYSFHTMSDAKDCHTCDLPDHRRLVDGHHYWIVRVNPADARKRGLKTGDLSELYNDRGSVICWTEATERVPPGTVHSYESSAIYEPLGEPGESPDRGGCVNILTPARPIIKRSHSIACNSCLIEIRPWAEGGRTNG
ncbi:MAG: molybdopterin-dependent oxidoreductase [Deltaproteobacteria bacterium]|jgi:trimethylamine-N-oxide reductase (cytochrome c)|nr:molybdopterin-dependent oxidoreductase [Deltaproteobacteria bacterium]